MIAWATDNKTPRVLYLVTLNTGGALCCNSRESHMQAAGNWSQGGWGVEYVPLSAPWGVLGAFGAFASKLEMDSLPVPGGSLAGVSRVCWIDADTAVREDCPNPFDLVPPGHIGGVLNLQDDNTEADHVGWWRQVAAVMGSSAAYNPKTYINGGLMVFDLPEHGKVWARARDAVRGQGVVNPMTEQTAVNIAIAESGCPVTILPPSMNRIGRDAWTPRAALRHHIIHAANIHKMRGGKHVPLSAPNFRLVPGKPWVVVGGGPSRIDATPEAMAGAFVAATNDGIPHCVKHGITPEIIWLSDGVAVRRHAEAANAARRHGARLITSLPSDDHLQRAGLAPPDERVRIITAAQRPASAWKHPYNRRRFSGLMLLEWVVREMQPASVLLCGFDGYPPGTQDYGFTQTIIEPLLREMIDTETHIQFTFVRPPTFAVSDRARVQKLTGPPGE